MVFPTLLTVSLDIAFKLQSASPPAIGESSPIVNVLWATTNFIIGLFLFKIGEFEFGLTTDTYSFFTGALLVALVLAWHFGRVRNP